jgi:vacuolar-type H+-ATPase subunit E/Vma4
MDEAGPAEPGPGALIGAIDEQAEQERARIISEAEQQAARILAKADEECGRLKAEALAGLEKELAAEQLRLLGEARMRARAEGLTRRRAILAEAFQRAREEISRRQQGPQGAAAQAALVEEARAAVGEPCSVQVSEDGGIQAVSEDGRRSAENGLQGRLLRAQSAVEDQVARRLFG